MASLATTVAANVLAKVLLVVRDHPAPAAASGDPDLAAPATVPVAAAELIRTSRALGTLGDLHSRGERMPQLLQLVAFALRRS